MIIPPQGGQPAGLRTALRTAGQLGIAGGSLGIRLSFGRRETGAAGFGGSAGSIVLFILLIGYE